MRTLLSMLAPSRFRHDASKLESLGMWIEDAFSAGRHTVGIDDLIGRVKVSNQMWLTIVSTAPARGKRALQGDLRSGDLGVAVHSVQRLAVEDRYLVINSTPMNLLAVASESVGVAAVALVFSPRMLALDDLLQMRVWKSMNQMDICLSDDGLGLELRSAHVLITSVLQKLLASHKEGGFTLESMPDDDRGVANAILDAWCARELVTSQESDGRSMWSLTEQGVAAVQAGLVISEDRLLLDVRPNASNRASPTQGQPFQCSQH